MIETVIDARTNNEEDLQEKFLSEDYQKVKNYLLLLRTNTQDQKEIGEKFFNSNMNQKFIHNNLHLIIENLEEKDDVRIQATVMLKKLYNEGGKYLKYRKQIDEEELPSDYKHITNSTKENILALPSGFPSEKVSRNLDLYDSLPYIDGHNLQDARIAEEMKKLIQEQMAIMKRENPAVEENYLNKINKDHPLFKFNKDHKHHDDILKKELERVEIGKKLEIFKSRIQTVFDNPPPSKFHDGSTWRNLIEGINYSLQQMNVKNFNLDLLIKYGPNMWKRFLKGLECLIIQLENEKNSLEKKSEEINQQRKFSQIEALEKLNELAEKKKYNLYQNVEAHKQILKLRYKIKKLIKYKKNKLMIKKRKAMKSKLTNK